MDTTAAVHKILVIDDEENYRQVIIMTLQMAGYEVFEATNGLDGLAAAKRHSPDLILCDVNMPKMDGHELLNALKLEKEFTGLPFIFLTGNAGPGDLRKGMQLGADDYLTKPFTADELLSAVEARLTKKKTIQHYIESQFDDIKSNIAHSLPHEFRTPLNGILGFSQLLVEEENLPETEVKNIGAMIYKSGQRLHRLLENMVLFGQLQLWLHDKKKITALRTEQTAITGRTLRAVAEQVMNAHNRPGSVVIVTEDLLLQISGQHLKKILEEAIDNALKFSEPGTSVSVRCAKTGGSVSISIQDSGRGMTDEQLGKVSGFQQFERGYYEQQGAGLGLVIIKNLAEIHGGALTINSVKNSGTTVTITLPAAE